MMGEPYQNERVTEATSEEDVIKLIRTPNKIHKEYHQYKKEGLVKRKGTPNLYDKQTRWHHMCVRMLKPSTGNAMQATK